VSKTFAFLRAINVGGHTVPMAKLRTLFDDLGFRQVETFIASGNVVFEPVRTGEAALAARIGAGLEAALGYEVVVFLRSGEELAALLAGCPFSAAEREAARALNVAFLSASLTPNQEARLQSLGTELDEFRARGREVWWRCQAKQHESTFSNAVFERALGIRATFRGFGTLQRLAAKYLT